MKSRFEKILVSVDGSHSCERAKEATALIAKCFGSHVTVVHVISHDFMHPELRANYQLSTEALNEIEKSYHSAGDTILSSSIEFFKSKGIKVKSEIIEHEDIAEETLELAEKTKPGLLVVGNRSDDEASRFALGNVAEKIALYADCSVFVAKKKGLMKNFLVAVDGSEAANRALEWVLELAQQFKTHVTLLHVEEAKLFALEPKAVKEVGMRILNDAASKLKGLDCAVRLEAGNHSKTILKVEKEGHYDLIVLGSRGNSSVKRFLLGSVTADVSMHSHSSVLIVR
jgi:nucleotide-binding universal stress UspA family protein